MVGPYWKTINEFDWLSFRIWQQNILQVRNRPDIDWCVDLATQEQEGNTRFFTERMAPFQYPRWGFGIREHDKLCFVLALPGYGTLATAAALYLFGPDWLTCFEPLEGFYHASGFETKVRSQWCEELAPQGWKPEYGRPDVLTMRY